MHTIQVVLDEPLLASANAAAKRQNVNRSALIRRALQEYLKHLHTLELVERERKGYETFPQDEDEIRLWQEVAAWPED